ncbi:hypothetical protein N7537_000575 [Penicillium hordei]|uniref:Uncharacterized protein n=1 Tax=Penicillium hordei TaxID=40994 RepID=A0AAD6EDZ2_9EURO|nr:uncharacterized protein N7537_000575 [Penicillium hordei]KAJ5615461.1 hypothetical protein N7537_000575 [Penicillium hordei]
MSELYKAMSPIVPVLRGYRKCLDSDDHFFTCDYEIDHRTPDEAKLAEVISELHRTSVSSTGQVGFHVTVHDGIATRSPFMASY